MISGGAAKESRGKKRARDLDEDEAEIAPGTAADARRVRARAAAAGVAAVRRSTRVCRPPPRPLLAVGISGAAARATRATGRQPLTRQGACLDVLEGR